MSNTMQDIAVFIPAKYRKIIYTALFVAGVLVTATTAGFVAAGLTLPKVLIAVNAALVPLNTAAHYLAKQNVAPESPTSAA